VKYLPQAFFPKIKIKREKEGRHIKQYYTAFSIL
jgi:hypothetical protein